MLITICCVCEVLCSARKHNLADIIGIIALIKLAYGFCLDSLKFCLNILNEDLHSERDCLIVIVQHNHPTG